MAEIIDRLTRVAEQVLSRLKVKSALNPSLWLCGLTLPFGFTGTLSTTGGIQLAFLALMLAPVLTCIVGFFYFMWSSPDKLRSEEYELKKIALSLIEEKGGSIPVSLSSVEAIANYDYRYSDKIAIEGGEK
jgi:hypothetical protein